VDVVTLMDGLDGASSTGCSERGQHLQRRPREVCSAAGEVQAARDAAYLAVARRRPAPARETQARVGV
jgi:hypothetical protein